MASARFYFAPTPCKLGPFTLNSQTVWLQGERFKLSGLDYYMCAVMGSNEFGPASAEDVKAAIRNSQPFDFPIEAVWQGPFIEPRAEWIEAVRQAPNIKEDFFTVLSLHDCLPQVKHMLDQDPRLAPCFVA